MACSKLFVLPELLHEVVQYLRNDFSTLFSCILVNRLWCRLAIPLLWEDPFSTPTEDYAFIEIYLRNLNNNDKAQLYGYGFHINLFPSKFLFNYPHFVKSLSTFKVFRSVEYWVLTLFNLNYTSINFTNFIRLVVFELLFKIFIESNAHLRHFEVSDYNNHNDNVLIEKCSSQIINSQPNLSKIFYFTYNSSLLSLASSNCSNTLRTIIFYMISFENAVNYEVFEKLTALESIHILYCSSLNSNFIRQIINITKPFKLSLFNCKGFTIDLFKLLLQNSGNYLENIELGLSINNELKQQLIVLIKRYCTRLKYLGLLGLNNQNMCSAFNLIKCSVHTLSCLSINLGSLYNFDYNQLNEDIGLSSTVLRNLGQILPCKLEYLSLSLKINAGDFEVFLSNSHNTFIKKFLIRNTMQKESLSILPCIKEHVMKTKRIEYLAIEEISFRQRIDFFSFDHIRREFEVYGVKVRNVDDLHFGSHKFIEELS